MPLDGSFPQTNNKQTFRFPGPNDRLFCLGRTGSGKTHAACWILSHSDYWKKPWIIVDFKRDPLIRSLPVKRLDLKARLPADPGLYVVRPNHPFDKDDVEDLLMRIWRRGRMGLYVDEGHMMPDKGGLEAILTQGRAKHIPAIVLSQRPVWLNRYSVSEADFIQLFHLNDKRDRQIISGFMPPAATQKLPRHHSFYYDIGEDHLFHLDPVPDRDTILNSFEKYNPRRIQPKML